MANDKGGITEQALQGLPMHNLIGGPLAAAAEARAAAARAQAEFAAAQAAQVAKPSPDAPSEPDPKA